MQAAKNPLKSRLDQMVAQSKFKTQEKTSKKHYTKKFGAGKIIGLQNLLPIFADHANTVFYTDNSMVAELHQVDIEPLRQAIAEDRDVLKKLWLELLPGALLLIKSQLELPQFILDKDWHQTVKMLEKYSELTVLDKDEQANLPAGGFVLQGSLEQLIQKELVAGAQPAPRHADTVLIQHLKVEN
jgi:hypothetical protein